MKRYHHDPVCGVKLKRGKAYHVKTIADEEFLLCCPECQTKFNSNQEVYIEKIKIAYEKNQSKVKNRIY